MATSANLAADNRSSIGTKNGLIASAEGPACPRPPFCVARTWEATRAEAAATSARPAFSFADRRIYWQDDPTAHVVFALGPTAGHVAWLSIWLVLSIGLAQARSQG